MTGDQQPSSPPFTVGLGYDVHRFAEGRKLVLGGVEIDYKLGLDGHSDADVLLHAIMDALLGAAGLPDIGNLFPNTDSAWKDASSLDLLADVVSRLEPLGWQIGNVDATVIAEAPKIYTHVSEMKRRISAVLKVSQTQVGIKATTNDRMGFVGRKEAIAAMATALLYRDKPA